MASKHESKFLDDPKFQSLLVGCLESLQRDVPIDREALANDFPEYAQEIERFLKDRQLLEQVASELDDVEPSEIAIPAYERTIATSSEPEKLAIGDTIRYIGEYEILDEIARGGMGVVFKARQQKLRRVVALKMILGGRLADDTDIQRFYREARASGQLKHPHIVPVHEIGEHEGRHYFTMDFIDGRSLAEEIREESLAPRRAAEIVRVVAEAVQFAHEQGTVHRDLKPANVLLTPDDSPHITDFGLAKMLQSVDEPSRAELTASGQILGTPSYMSPEQASGKQELVGPASDVYSLGAILYACLTGRAPFVADSPVDTLLQVMKKEPVSPRELNPSIPKDLETICLKCLAKETHKRYGTAQELADDLNRFLAGLPVRARPVGRISKAARWCRRNKAVAALLGLLFLSMAAGTYVSAHYAVVSIRHAKNEAEQRAEAVTAREEAEDQRRRAELARREAEQQRDAATESKAAAEKALKQEAVARKEAEAARQAEADARQAAENSLVKAEAARREAKESRTEALWQTYVARLQPMMYRVKEREYGQLESMIEQAKPQSQDEPDFRGWEWHYFHDLSRQLTRKIAEGKPFGGLFDWHEKTKRLATFRAGKLELWSGDPLELQKRLGAHTTGLVRFSPDGTQVVVANRFTAKVIAVAMGDVQATIDLAKHPDTNRDSKKIGSIQWRPDGAALATGTEMGAIHLWDPQTGELIKEVPSLPNNFPCNDMHWHPTEPILAVGTRYGRVFAIGTDRDEPVWVKRIDRDYVFSVSWNPSGTMLAGATNGTSDGSRLVIWDRNGEQVMRSAGGAITGVPTIDWLDDEQLVVATSDHDIHLFRSNDDRPIKTIRVHDGPVEHMLHYGDGKRVISSASGSIRITGVGNEVSFATSIPVHKFGIKAVSWSPDSNRVATVSWDGIVAITNVRTGEVIHQMDGHRNGAVNDVAWSPDGLRVASCDHSGEFRIWDADAGTSLFQFNGGSGSGGFNALAWIDDDHIVGGQERLSLYNVNDGETVRQIADSLLHSASLSYSPKRKLLGHLGSRRLAIFKPEGEMTFQKQLDAASGLAWSPDGKLLVTGGETGIGVIDCVKFVFLTTIKGHAGTVTGVCFSPDGTRIASSGRDGTVRIWDRATGAELLILKHPDVRSFSCVSWSPDGSTIAAGAKGLVVTWKAPSSAESRAISQVPTGVIASVKNQAEELAELTKALDDEPKNVQILRKRGEWYAGQLRWRAALEDFTKIVELRPNFMWERVYAARAGLMAGRMDIYQHHIDVAVNTVLERHTSMAGVTCDFIAKTVGLSRNGHPELERLLQLSKSHSDAKGNAIWASHGIILLPLRLGRAGDVLQLVEQYNDESRTNHRIFLDAVKALAHHQLDEPTAAEQALEGATALATTAWFEPTEDEPITYADLVDYVEAKTLLDEALRMIPPGAR